MILPLNVLIVELMPNLVQSLFTVTAFRARAQTGRIEDNVSGVTVGLFLVCRRLAVIQHI